MTEALIGVYGASGFGREVLPLVREQLKHKCASFVFVDDGDVSGSLNGFSVITYDEFINREFVDKKIVFAIANSAVRENLADKCMKDGVPVLDVRADNAVILDEVEMGE